MKDRKGFTLIELLVVIAILAVILLIAVPIIVGNIDKSKVKSYDNQVALFIEGAKRLSLEYNKDLIWEDTEVEGVKKTVITLRELAEKDYVDLPVTNPKTGEPFDPDKTKVTIYKDKDGNYSFEYDDETGGSTTNGFKLMVGSKIQTITRGTIYDTRMIMADVYGSDDDGKDITNTITYTCKYNQSEIDCSHLSLSTKEPGTYYITYSLTSNNKTKTESRTIKVLESSRPIIEVRPTDDGVTKVSSVRVTIIYPEGSKSRTYGTKYETNKTYVMGFDVNENQTITADCIDKNGLKCETATEDIRNIKIALPTITVNLTPTVPINGYYKQGVARVVFRDKIVTGEEYYIKTSKAATSSASLSQACGTGNLPGTCNNITSTTALSANTWYKVGRNINVNVTYSDTSTSAGSIKAVIWASTTFGDIAEEQVEKIDGSGPTITFGTRQVNTNNAVINYTIADDHSGLGTDITCKYGTTSGNLTTNGSNISTTSCTLPNLKRGNTYYYQICISDKLGNKTCTRETSVEPVIVPNPTITMNTNMTTPSASVNGYYQKQVVTVTYNLTNVTNPERFVKTTRAGTSSVAVTQTCGTSTMPGTCTNITSTTTLSPNTWYKVSGNINVTYNTTSNETGTIYATTYDGTNYSGSNATYTISKIDKTNPGILLGIPVIKTNEATINYTISDEHSGVNTTTCKYGITEGSYTTNGSNVTSTSCKLTGLKSGTTYYYQICASDKVGNQAQCKTGSTAPVEITNPKITLSADSTKTIPTTAQNGYYKQETLLITYTSTNITSPSYYIYTTRAGVGTVNGTPCTLTGTAPGKPGTCSGTATKNYAANTWYKVTGNLEIKYTTASTTTGTLYALTYDGTNYSGSATYTISKIDRTKAVPKAGTITKTKTTLLIPVTVTESESGVASVKCKYGTTSGNLTSTVTATAGTSTSCKITGLTANTPYYYQICANDKVGNGENCTTEASTKTGTMTVGAITYTNTPTTSQNGYLKSQVANVPFTTSNVTNPVFYIKTTRAATSSVAVNGTCGTGTTPTTCTNITSTTNLSANTWYRVNATSNVTVKVTYNKSATTTATLIGAVYDGVTYTTGTAGTISKIDTTKAVPKAGTITKTKTTLLIPVTVTESESGVASVKCKYGTTSGNLTSTVTATAGTSTSCKITGLTANTPYYYQICANDKVGNGENCTTEASTKTGTMTVGAITYTNTPTTSQNGYLKSQVANVPFTTSNVTNPVFYIKTTRAATSSVAVNGTCGTGTTPTTCTNITSTTNLSANTWYRVNATSNVTVKVTYNKSATTTATLIGAVYDGVTYTTGTAGTISKIDTTSPTLTLNSTSTTKTSITVLMTASDSQSGVGTVTCKYGITSGSYNTSATGANSTMCTMSGLSGNKTYYYQICVSDKVGNTATCKTGSAKTITYDEAECNDCENTCRSKASVQATGCSRACHAAGNSDSFCQSQCSDAYDYTYNGCMSTSCNGSGQACYGKYEDSGDTSGGSSGGGTSGGSSGGDYCFCNPSSRPSCSSGQTANCYAYPSCGWYCR